MPTLLSRIGLFAVTLGALGACASQSTSAESHLDGPVDYEVEGGFSRTKTSVHLELDGSATKRVTSGSGPTMMTSGTVAAATLDKLRDHIAAVDLASLRADYNCDDFSCGADFPVVMLGITADGATKQIRVDRAVNDQDLPAGLVVILNDLDEIMSQLP